MSSPVPADAPIVSLQGRTIVVTGAGQGIGKALTELALQLGANVVALDMNADTPHATLAPLPQARVLAVVGSVVDPLLAAQAVSDAVARFGAVHGLVNNAGVTRPAMIEEMSAQQWQDVIDVHLTGTFFWTQAVSRHMLERVRGGDSSGGAIVNISSDSGLVARCSRHMLNSVLIGGSRSQSPVYSSCCPRQGLAACAGVQRGVAWLGNTAIGNTAWECSSEK